MMFWLSYSSPTREREGGGEGEREREREWGENGDLPMAIKYMDMFDFSLIDMTMVRKLPKNPRARMIGETILLIVALRLSHFITNCQFSH